jgi:hypothetical protein
LQENKVGKNYAVANSLFSKKNSTIKEKEI